MHRYKMMGLALAVSMTLTACGGGGSDSAASSSAVGASSTSSTTASTTTGAASVSTAQAVSVSAAAENPNSQSQSNGIFSVTDIGAGSFVSVPPRQIQGSSYSALSSDKPLLDPVAVYYVRPDGGNFEQCTGLSNNPYPGNGAQQDCAFSHLFELLPPGKEARMAGGSEVNIASGEYRMGYTENLYSNGDCHNRWAWDCYMSPVPSGPSELQPTRILGEGWNQQCSNAPVFNGVERAKRILNLEGSSNVDVRCLELTDLEACTDSHLHGLSNPNNWGHSIYQSSKRQACNRNLTESTSSPFGLWATGGIYAVDGENLILKDVNIHGFSAYGMHAGRLKNVLMENVSIVGNGKVGFDGDVNETSYNSETKVRTIVKDSSNSGDIVMRGVQILWNGCIEQLDGSIGGCWGQSAGGYGDGIGTEKTAGHWVIEDSDISYNSSDGVDLLYVRGGDVTIARTSAIGNAGNAFKLSGNNLLLENSIGISNCAHFKDQPYDAATDLCRAGAAAVSLSLRTDTSKAALINNYITGNGDGLISFGGSNESGLTSGNSLTIVNNIFEGDLEHHSPGDISFYMYSESNADEQYHIYNNQIGGTIKFSGGFPDCESGGTDNICADPAVSFSDDHLKKDLAVLPSNQGQGKGIAADQEIGGWVIPKYDFNGQARTGSNTDIGPYQVKSE